MFRVSNEGGPLKCHLQSCSACVPLDPSQTPGLQGRCEDLDNLQLLSLLFQTVTLLDTFLK